MAERFILADHALDGSPRFYTRSGTWSSTPRDACLFWSQCGALDAVPWHDLQHCRVVPAGQVFVAV